MRPVIVFVAREEKYLGPPRELLCSVWPIVSSDGLLSVSEPVVENLSVRVGASSPTMVDATVQLPSAGEYLIDLGLPNGASVRRVISAVDGEQHMVVVPFPGPPSTGNHGDSQRDTSIPRTVSAALKPPNLEEVDLEVTEIEQPLAVSIQELRAFVADAAAEWRSAKTLDALEGAGPLRRYRIPNRPGGNFRSGYVRKWLLVAAGTRHSTLIPYPEGWIEEGRYAFTLEVHRKGIAGIEANRWSADLQLMNPVYGSLIEHLTRRDLSSGEEVARSQRGNATKMLYQKNGNPFAAAAGAYLLVLGQGEIGTEVQWINNLTERFAWLPDGPIAAGWYRLRQAQSDTAEWQKARTLLLLACARGLPYFTIGLQVLLEGMTLLNMAFPEDGEVRDALAAIRAAEVACVRSCSFTTLQVSRLLGLPVR